MRGPTAELPRSTKSQGSGGDTWDCGPRRSEQQRGAERPWAERHLEERGGAPLNSVVRGVLVCGAGVQVHKVKLHQGWLRTNLRQAGD